MLRAWVLMVVVLTLPISAFAGTHVMNDTEGPVTGLRINFSQPVTIAGYGDVLMSVEPQGESTEFLFTGGEVEAWGDHWLSWEPASATLDSYEWLVSLPVAIREVDYTHGAVVQRGAGPQAFDGRVKFYPDQTEISPGETVVWYLKLDGLEGPFTIVPDMDNDNNREPSIRTEEDEVVIPFTYATPNIYVPYVTIYDGSGSRWTVYTTHVLAVMPEIEQRSRVGIDLPSPEDPVGDVLKGAHVLTVDQDLFDTQAGKQYIHDQINRWADNGINLVVLNFLWFTQREDTAIQVPIYCNNPWPAFWTGTLSLEDLISLTDWIHGEGLRVAWRYQMVGESEYTCTLRLSYAPTDLAIYFHYQAQIKPFLASVAERAGVEMFGLDTENPAFSQSFEACDILARVREAYTGVVSNSERVSDGLALRSPVNALCDVLYISSGLAGYTPMADSVKDWALSELRKAFSTQVRTEYLPIIDEHKKPLMFEVFAEYDGRHSAFQSNAYSAILEVMSADTAPIMGIVFHEFVLHRDFRSQVEFQPLNHPAEQVMKRYFTQVLGEQRHYDFDVEPSVPGPLEILETFEAIAFPRNMYLTTVGGRAEPMIDRGNSVEGNSTLSVHFDSSNTDGAFAYYVLHCQFDHPQDWTSFETFSFWMRNEANPTSLIVSVFDANGDRFTSDLDIAYSKTDSWRPYTTILDELIHPDWAETGDGQLGLGRVTGFSILERSFDARDHNTWFDYFYLGGPQD